MALSDPPSWHPRPWSTVCVMEGRQVTSSALTSWLMPSGGSRSPCHVDLQPPKREARVDGTKASSQGPSLTCQHVNEPPWKWILRMTAGLADTDCNLTRGPEPGGSGRVRPEFGVVCHSAAGYQHGPVASPHTRIPLFEGQVWPLIRGGLAGILLSGPFAFLPHPHDLWPSKVLPGPWALPSCPGSVAGEACLPPGPHVSTPRWPRVRGFPAG